MSQSGRLTLNQPVPGAGIQTVTGNAGGAVPGDGAANINLVGAGTITVTGTPMTNTLTIASTGVPATYTTDTGAAVPDAFGNLNVAGGANITTDNTVANTVTINLDDNVVLTGNLDALNVRAANDVTAIAGDIMANAGDIIAAGYIVGNSGGSFLDQVVISANGLESTGPTILNSLNRGVVQVDGTHTLFSDNGADGQLLIGGGVAPAWANIQGTANHINITNAANAVTVDVGPQVPLNFLCDVGGAAYAANNLLTLYGVAPNIHTSASGVFPNHNNIYIWLSDNVTINDTLTVTNACTVNGTTTLNGALQANGNLACAGAAVFSNTVSCATDVTVHGTLTSNGPFVANGTSHLVGVVLASADMGVAGNFAVGGSTELGTDATNSVMLRGDLYMPEYTAGIMRTDATGTVTSTNGANGQVLIGGGTNAEWRNIASADGSVVVTNGANSIDLSAASSARLAFRAVMNGGVPYLANVTQPIFVFGKGLALTTIFDTAGAFYPGDGGLVAATFTAPYSGIFNITMKGCLGRTSSSPGLFDNRSTYLRIRNNTSGAYYHILQPATSSLNSAGLTTQPTIANLLYTELIRLNAGDVIQFELEAHGYASAFAGGWQVGQDYSGAGTTAISGFLVYRL